MEYLNSDGKVVSDAHPLPVKTFDGGNVTIGTKADVAATSGDATPFSVIALLKGIWNKLGAVVIAASPKKAVITVHNAIVATTTSGVIDLSGYNAAKVYIEITGTGSWKFDMLGSYATDGVFVENGNSYYASSSKSLIIPCTSDFIKIVATEIVDGSTLTVKIQGLVGDGIDTPQTKYKDLGLIIDATNMAAGASVASAVIRDVEWVRNILIQVKSDQQYDITAQRIDIDGNVDSGSMNIAVTQSGIAGAYRTHVITPNISGIQSVLGRGVKFTLKNSSASPNTIGKVNVQLMGA